MKKLLKHNKDALASLEFALQVGEELILSDRNSLKIQLFVFLSEGRIECSLDIQGKLLIGMPNNLKVVQRRM